MEILSQVATTMQMVLTETANQLAQETSLIKRQRKLSGASFAKDPGIWLAFQPRCHA
jgi:hypothetical protein